MERRIKIRKDMDEEMIHEEKKTAKIVEELTMFFFAIGAVQINSRIEKEDANAVITFEADYDPAYRDKLEDLDQYLNGQKNHGMEGVYWELAGSGDPGETSQLLLIGMMTDKAEVEINESHVKVKLYKKLLN